MDFRIGFVQPGERCIASSTRLMSLWWQGKGWKPKKTRSHNMPGIVCAWLVFPRVSLVARLHHQLEMVNYFVLALCLHSGQLHSNRRIWRFFVQGDCNWDRLKTLDELRDYCSVSMVPTCRRMIRRLCIKLMLNYIAAYCFISWLWQGFQWVAVSMPWFTDIPRQVLELL